MTGNIFSRNEDIKLDNLEAVKPLLCLRKIVDKINSLTEYRIYAFKT